MPDAPDTPVSRFAWDGLAFDVPADWNLSAYEIKPQVSRLGMEDDLGLRLDMEWARTARMPTPETLRRRYDGIHRTMRAADATVSAVDGLPPGWSAWVFSLPDGRRMALAYVRLPAATLFAALMLHFEPTSLRVPVRRVRALAASFAVLDGPVIPWAFYDVAFALSRAFRLAGTSLQAGSKHLRFEWRGRRLFLWFFSPADAMQRRQETGAWCAGVLNRLREVRGPVFAPGPQPGTLAWRRDWRYPFGRFEDLYRACPRYRAWYRHDPARNQILLALFQYRRDADLDAMAFRW